MVQRWEQIHQVQSSAGALTTLNFDQADGGSVFYGKCKDLRYYDTEGMTDTEIDNLLTQLTQ